MMTAISALVLLITIITADAEPWNDEQRLVLDLWEACPYDARTRPVMNVSEATQVTLQVDVFAIFNLDSSNQQFTVASAFNLRWRDSRLRWDSSNYSGLEFVSVQAGTVWYPRIQVLNSFDATTIITDNTEVLVSSEGALHVTRSVIHKTQCHLTQQEFPFDFQACEFILGTESVPSGVVWIEASHTNKPREQVKTVDNWNLEDITVTGTRSPTCITIETSEVSCQRTSQAIVCVYLRREANYHMFTVFMPCTILTLIASMIFWIPPECGEKLSFGISIFFGFVIFQLIVQDALVDAGDGTPSVLIRYVLFNFALAGFAVMSTAVSITLHHRGNQEETSRGTVLCDECQAQTRVVDGVVNQAYEGEDDADSQEKVRPKKKKPRDWKKIAKYLDRVSFGLCCLIYVILTSILVGEVALYVAAPPIGCP